VRDIITVGETGSDTVEYVRITSVTNNAAPTAEATATGGSSGTKPESAMAMLRVTESVKTIPHWIPATNRSLADAPQLRTIIDNFLRYGIEEELEDQILTGDASGENFDGVLHVAGTTPQAFDTDILKTTRKARTKVRTVGRARPTAYVMNPLDWEKFDLLQDNEARYYYGGPMNPGSPRLWGLPVVESEGMTEGTTVCADWKLAILWDRMQTAISMSNSHSDFFIRNLVAILAEMRAAFGVIRPPAFVIADLTA
jgi:HK97 family phage major capsid protein